MMVQLHSHPFPILLLFHSPIIFQDSRIRGHVIQSLYVSILYHQQLDLIHMVLGQDLRTQTVIYFLIAGRAGW